MLFAAFLSEDRMSTIQKDGIPADVAENYVAFSDLRTDVNRYEVNCGECGKVFYTDKDNSSKWSRAIEQAIDNPFLCDNCRRAEDEMAYLEH